MRACREMQVMDNHNQHRDASDRIEFRNAFHSQSPGYSFTSSMTDAVGRMNRGCCADPITRNSAAFLGVHPYEAEDTLHETAVCHATRRCCVFRHQRLTAVARSCPKLFQIAKPVKASRGMRYSNGFWQFPFARRAGEGNAPRWRHRANIKDAKSLPHPSIPVSRAGNASFAAFGGGIWRTVRMNAFRRTIPRSAFHGESCSPQGIVES